MATEYLNNKSLEALIRKFQGTKKQKERCALIIEDLKVSYKSRENKNSYHKKRLESKQEEYTSSENEFNELKDCLATAFLKLSENIVRYARFSLIDSDDATQEGVMICFDKINRFDPDKGKAFNYMTTCILNHFRQLYRSAKNYQELKKKYCGYIKDQLEEVCVINGKERVLYKSSMGRRTLE
jgi:hypothetical protein